MATARTTKRTWRSSARGTKVVQKTLLRLGKRVRSLRNEKGLTQEEAAARASLDAKHFQAVEGGRTNPTVASLIGIARSLGVRLADLFDGV